MRDMICKNCNKNGISAWKKILVYLFEETITCKYCHNQYMVGEGYRIIGLFVALFLSSITISGIIALTKIELSLISSILGIIAVWVTLMVIFTAVLPLQKLPNLSEKLRVYRKHKKDFECLLTTQSRHVVVPKLCHSEYHRCLQQYVYITV